MTTSDERGSGTLGRSSGVRSPKGSMAKRRRGSRAADDSVTAPHGRSSSKGRGRSKKSLADDRRGAIMVVAVFMSAFLVGGLWYIIGIGDTILYRERMQEAADAVAYAGAVYHARGMNIIAMINIIMAGILAVLVAMKLVQVMNTIANVISCAIAAFCAIGVGCWAVPICTYTTNLSIKIQQAISKYEKFVKATLPVLSKTQKGIAYAMPWAAEAKSVYVATKYYSEPAETGGIISASLLPTEGRLGLPVQEMPYPKLCKKAGEFVAEVVFMPFPFAGWMKGVIGNIVATFPGYFCGGSGDFDFSDKAVNEYCKNKKKAAKKKKKKFKMSKCRKNAKKELTKGLPKLATGGKGGTSGSTMTGKEVFAYAENGNAFFQVWSVVVGNDYWPKEAEKGVAIAAWNQREATPEVPWGKVSFAQAEFYYDDVGAWDDLKEEAMWNMYWRARLRRVRPPTDDVATILTSVVGTKLLSKVDGKLKEVLSNNSFVGYVIGAGLNKKLSRGLRNVFKGGAKWADEKIENSMLKEYGEWEMIH